MRSTWINKIQSNPKWRSQMRIIFLIAVDKNDQAVVNQMAKESNYSNDILLLDLSDSYKMHTLKTIAAMEYFLKHCFNESFDAKNKIEPRKPIFIKITDDIILFQRKLMEILENLSSSISDRYVAGFIASGWNVQYATGSLYCISPKAVKEIYEYARCITDLPFFDDVLIGVLSQNLLNISTISIPAYTHYEKLPSEIRNHAGILSQFCFLHDYKFYPTQQINIWQQVENFLASREIIL